MFISEGNMNVALQPAKLTEAFKYFLQGMGYSTYERSFSPFQMFPHVSGDVMFSSRGAPADPSPLSRSLSC